MKKLFCSAFLFSTLFFSACKKDGTSSLFDFSKITVTDASCIYISEVDTTDWTYDDSWTEQETNFLKFSDTSVVVTDTATGYIQVDAICPNPNEGSFNMNINTQRQCKMKLVCVNTEMQVLYYLTRKFTGGSVTTSYDFRSLTAFHKNENYRLYYGFYNSKDSLYYKGHGDFRIE